jgi:uncharacterized membrane protein
MAELLVVAFDNSSDADRALDELRRLQREYLIDLEDAVVAVRRGDGGVELKQSVSLVGPGAATGGLWGTGALSAKLVDYGINDDFIRSLGKTLQPDTSALFVLVRKAQPEKVLSELSRFRGRVLRSSLSPEQEARLQAALSRAAATPDTGTSASGQSAKS